MKTKAGFLKKTEKKIDKREQRVILLNKEWDVDMFKDLMEEKEIKNSIKMHMSKIGQLRRNKHIPKIYKLSKII